MPGKRLKSTTKPFMTFFARCLVERRNALRWSQETLAVASGVSRARIKAIESGDSQNSPTIDTVFRRLNGLRISQVWFFQELAAVLHGDEPRHMPRVIALNDVDLSAGTMTFEVLLPEDITHDTDGS